MTRRPPREGLRRQAGPLAALLAGFLGLALVGCAAEDASAGRSSGPGGSGGSGGSGGALGPSPWVQGGQTGGLLPACGLTMGVRGGGQIPAGDGGLVIHTTRCGAGFNPDEVTLVDGDGNPVDFEVEQIDDDTVLLRPTDPLASGEYSLGTPDGEATQVSVGAPRPQPPMLLGAMTQLQAGCNADFLLTLAPEVLPHLAQLRLNVRVDGGPLSKWFDYGELTVTDGEALVSLPPCLSACFGAPGTHQVVVIGEVGGELGTLAPLAASFEVNCQTPLRDRANSPTTCSATGAGGEPARTGGVVTWLALAGLWLSRRRWQRRLRPGAR